MRLDKYFLVFVVSTLGVSSTTSCVTSLTSEHSQDLILLEEKAFQIFVDSIVHRRLYFRETVGDRIGFVPREIEDGWVENGMFFGYKIYSNDSISGVSYPFYDEFSLLEYANSNVLDDSTAKEAKGYVADYTAKLNKIENQVIQSPKGVEKMTYVDFLRIVPDKSVFVSVKHGITSDKSNMVQIVVYRPSPEDPILFLEYKYFFYFDKSGNFIQWITYR